MKLGRSKSQQEEASGTEGKWALLSSATLSHTFFFSHLALPAILPLLYTQSGVPADLNRSDSSDVNAAKACLSDTLEQSLSALLLLRDTAARGTKHAQVGKAQEGWFMLPRRPSTSQTEVCARGCAEALPQRPLQQASSRSYSKWERRGETGRAGASVQSRSTVLHLWTPALHYLRYLPFITLAVRCCTG